METVVKKLYEALFLVDSTEASTDWDGVNTKIKNILTKSDAEIVSQKKWDERKLAYDINGKNRGTYILCYFKVEGEKIRNIERDIRLSEQIMRALILSTEAMSTEDIEKSTPAMQVEKYDQKTTLTKEADEQKTEKAGEEQIDPEYSPATNP